jgi:hypothetical protein
MVVGKAEGEVNERGIGEDYDAYAYDSFYVSAPLVPATISYVDMARGDTCWNALVTRESGWNPLAQNPISSAFGLGQFLNGTWEGTGYEKSDDPEIQLAAMQVYVLHRYGTFCIALRHNLRYNYY